MVSPAMFCFLPDLQNQTGVSAYGVDLKSNQRIVGHPLDSNVTIVHAGLSAWQVVLLSCRTQLGENIGCPPVACIASLGTMKLVGVEDASGSVLSDFCVSWILCMWCIYNRVLPSSSDWHPRRLVKAYPVLLVDSEISLINNL